MGKIVEVYQANYDTFWKQVDALIKKYNYEIYVYDEVERFRQWKSKKFDYPFELRKSFVGMSSVSLNKSEAFDSFKIGWSVTDVCLEGHFLDQLAKITKEMLKMIQAPISAANDDSSEPTSFLQECDNIQFWRLKYADNTKDVKVTDDYYEPQNMEDIILQELILTVDPFKTLCNRVSTQVLDYMGDLGGFTDAIFMLLAIFGEYFSHKFLQANIAQKYYTRKRNRKEYFEDKLKKYKEDDENPSLVSR